MKRHKAPTLVSMWMLDVFCCALGCVTLLWLLKTREAGFALDQTAEVRSQLTDTQLVLNEQSMQNIELGLKLDETFESLALVQKERDEQAKQLALVQEDLDKTNKRLALAEREATDTAKQLALTERKLTDSAKSLALLENKSTITEEELAKKKKELATLANNADELLRLLREKEKAREAEVSRVAELTTELNRMSQAKTETDKQGKELAKALERVKSLEKDLDNSNASIIDLQGTKAKLADKINRLEIETQNRFAGIAMTGKKVIFLVDMSGSMELTDENTKEPSKWPLVRDTLIKVMRSIPDMEYFQVIMFSNRVVYLLPDSKDWMKYEKGKTLDQIHNAMTMLKPSGDTNMYSAFEECYRFREKGLDTIYLLSDGLPNSGPGLTDAQVKANLSETDRSNLLAKHIRRTLNTTWNRSLPQHGKVRINSIGFFFESPDVGAFLWALSRENEGSFVGMSKP